MLGAERKIQLDIELELNGVKIIFFCKGMSVMYFMLYIYFHSTFV